MSSDDLTQDFAGADGLEVGRAYNWDELGAFFSVKPAYFSAAGGMPVSVARNAVLAITYPGGGRAFDYEDSWEGDDLIYTGRGQVGDQKRSGPNLDVAENRRTIYVFEDAGTRALRFLGCAICVEERTGGAPDRNGQMRNILQFRLRFPSDARSRAHRDRAPSSKTPRRRGTRVSAEGTPRAFDPSRRPQAHGSTGTPRDPEVAATLQEKARQDHHDLLVALDGSLRAAGWSEIEEIPAAIDLRARTPDGTGVIFEVKTISASNEISQTRGGLAQLLEYRLEYGTPEDSLCLVIGAPISVRRARLLAGLGVAVTVADAGRWMPANALGSDVVALLEPGAPE